MMRNLGLTEDDARDKTIQDACSSAKQSPPTYAVASHSRYHRKEDSGVVFFWRKGQTKAIDRDMNSCHTIIPMHGSGNILVETSRAALVPSPSSDTGTGTGIGISDGGGGQKSEKHGASAEEETDGRGSGKLGLVSSWQQTKAYTPKYRYAAGSHGRQCHTPAGPRPREDRHSNAGATFVILCTCRVWVALLRVQVYVPSYQYSIYTVRTYVRVPAARVAGCRALRYSDRATWFAPPGCPISKLSSDRG